MGREAIDSVVGIVTAIIGLAILSVILSRNANTMGVIQSASGGLAQDLTAAMSPVTGGGGGMMGMIGGIGSPGASYGSSMMIG